MQKARFCFPARGKFSPGRLNGLVPKRQASHADRLLRGGSTTQVFIGGGSFSAAPAIVGRYQPDLFATGQTDRALLPGTACPSEPPHSRLGDNLPVVVNKRCAFSTRRRRTSSPWTSGLPGMKGFEAGKRITCERPSPITVVSASVGRKTTMNALQAGTLTVRRAECAAMAERLCTLAIMRSRRCAGRISTRLVPQPSQRQSQAELEIR